MEPGSVGASAHGTRVCEREGAPIVVSSKTGLGAVTDCRSGAARGAALPSTPRIHQESTDGTSRAHSLVRTGSTSHDAKTGHPSRYRDHDHRRGSRARVAALARTNCSTTWKVAVQNAAPRGADRRLGWRQAARGSVNSTSRRRVPTIWEVARNRAANHEPSGRDLLRSLRRRYRPRP